MGPFPDTLPTESAAYPSDSSEVHVLSCAPGSSPRLFLDTYDHKVRKAHDALQPAVSDDWEAAVVVAVIQKAFAGGYDAVDLKTNKSTRVTLRQDGSMSGMSPVRARL